MNPNASVAERNELLTSGSVQSTPNRQEFWLDTCREVNQMHLGSAQVQEFYRKHGCRFAPPTPAQVCGILDALDGAMPYWEKDHPELFYQTLELSFPELLIRR